MVRESVEPSPRRRVVILEDNDDRQDAFREILAERFPMFELCFAVTSGEGVRLIDEALDRIAMAILDNDLDVLQTSFGKSVDAGDGIQVAEYLSRRPPTFPVVVHTTNTPARERIVNLLTTAGWAVSTVVPYGDLKWIGKEWFRAVANAIKEHPPDAVQGP